LSFMTEAHGLRFLVGHHFSTTLSLAVVAVVQRVKTRQTLRLVAVVVLAVIVAMLPVRTLVEAWALSFLCSWNLALSLSPLAQAVLALQQKTLTEAWALFLCLPVLGVTVVLVVLAQILLGLLAVPVLGLVQITPPWERVCPVRVQAVALALHPVVAVAVVLARQVQTLQRTPVGLVVPVFLPALLVLLLVGVAVVVAAVTRLLLAVRELAVAVLVETNLQAPLLER
jgi:hypothetical protein